MSALLCLCMAGSTAPLSFSISARDPLRSVTGLLVLVLPLAFQLLIDGFFLYQVNTLILGSLALMLVPVVAKVFLVQAGIMQRQFESQLKAKQAADAVATVAVTKSRFFAAVSHDLRQPVHAIGLYIDPITRLARSNGDSKAQNAVTGIMQSWKILNDLLSGVLDIARLDAAQLNPELKRHEIAPLVEEIILEYSAFAESVGVRLVTLVKPNCFVHADKVMLKRVMSNLIGNAIKFSPMGQTVLVVARPWRKQWRIQVRDAGCGISPKDQQHIFDEFVQLDNYSRDRSHGLGLGLAIAKRLTELQGGVLSVRSRLGEGCSMTILLPEAHASSASQVSEQETGLFTTGDTSIYCEPELTNLPSCSVLLVEDDQLVGYAMTELMNSWGLDVNWEKSVPEALAHNSEYEIAICDWRLPGEISGFDLALMLRNNGKRVLIVTGETDAVLLSMSAHHDVPLLIKPVAAQALHQAIGKLL